MDPAFEGVGQEAGLRIWRIEQFEVKPLDPKSYGTFYSGDSYILLHTKMSKNEKKEWNIHFWLGQNTSQDEAGTAAIKSVELDDCLGGIPVQHREVQGHETKQFLSYFKQGIRYLEGGIASGFQHVEDEVIKRLLQVKGKRNVRAWQVPLDVNSMNKGDCFILDAGPNIYVWVGEKSGHLERIKAIQVANGIRDDIHAGRSSIQIIDSSSSPSEISHFFEELGGGGSDDVKDPAETEDDVEHERSRETEISLYKIWEEGGELKFEKIADRPLKQEYLQSGDCFLLNGGIGGLFVWIGKESSKEERVQAMKLAEKYLDARDHPKWTSIVRVIDGGEPPMFKQYFSSWKEPEDQIGLGRVYTTEQIAASVPDAEFDVGSLHREKRHLLAKSAGKVFGFMPDDGTGEVQIWRIENFELAPLDPASYGMFFGGDSYVLKYAYDVGGLQRYIIYFWQGQNSSQDERAASAICAVQLDNELGGKAVQVRVVQGMEPEHFLRIFKGRMVIFMGGHASGFRNIHDHDTYDTDGTRMFQVKGTNQFNIRAVQVPEVAGSLNGHDTFVVETPSDTYLWIGKGSSEEEQEMAKAVVELVSPGREPVTVLEGEEVENFWNSIGGCGDYQKSRTLPDKPLLSSRLFKCSIVGGKFRVEEVCNYIQEDLAEDDVMLLDTGDEIYVWIGKGASQEEKEKSLELADKYIETDPSDRSCSNTVVLTIHQGEEPAGFTSMFDSWNPTLWNN